MEKWKNIKHYEGLYKISDKGDVFGLKNKKKLKKRIQSTGKYHYVSLSKNGIVKNYRVHRLVAQAFILNKENKPQVNHKDCNTFNNNINNLEWVTGSENAKHSYENKRNIPPKTFKGKFGSEHNKSIMIKIINPESDITTFGSMSEAGRILKCDMSTISRAKRNIEKNNKSEYIFKKGDLKNFTLLPHMELVL